MTKDIFSSRLNNNHIPSLNGTAGHGVTIVSTNILSLTGQIATRFLTTTYLIKMALVCTLYC